MGKNVGVLLFTLVLLFAGVSAASSPASKCVLEYEFSLNLLVFNYLYSFYRNS